MTAAAFQMLDGIPTYNLFIGGEWMPSSRNEATASYNPATGGIYAQVHQAGARETELAIDAAHGAYKEWSDKIVSEREAVFLRAADALAAKSKRSSKSLSKNPVRSRARPASRSDIASTSCALRRRSCAVRRVRRWPRQCRGNSVLPSASRSA